MRQNPKADWCESHKPAPQHWKLNPNCTWSYPAITQIQGNNLFGGFYLDVSKIFQNVMHQPVFSDYRFIVSRILNRRNQPRGCQFGSLSRKACKCNFGKHDWRSLTIKITNLQSRRTENPENVWNLPRILKRGMQRHVWCLRMHLKKEKMQLWGIMFSLAIQKAFTCFDQCRQKSPTKTVQGWKL